MPRPDTSAEPAAYLVDCDPHDRHSIVTHVIGPFPDDEAAAAFAEEHDVASLGRRRPDWYIVSALTCTHTPDEYRNSTARAAP